MGRCLVTFVAFILLGLNGATADRYWIGATNNNWNDTGNWSATNGGIGGASVPGAADRVLLNSNGNVNLTLDLAPTVESIDIASGYTAIIDLNGNNLKINGATTNDFEDGTFNNTSGGEVIITCTGITYFRGTTFNPNVTATSSRLFLNGSTFNGTVSMTKNGASDDAGRGGNIFNNATSFSCTSAGYLMTGNVNPDTINGVLTLLSTGTRGIYLAHNSAGNYFSQNIIVNSTSTTGIRIGQNNGSSVLASNRTITVGGTGYSAGELRLRNFTQTGATAQSLSFTGTGHLYLYDSDFGGNVTFSAPRVITRGTRYRGTATITKNGVSDDQSAGGNRFDGNTVLNCSGADYLMMGNGSPDTFNLNLTLNNTGKNGIYLAYNSAGNYVGGNLTATNSGTGTNSWIYISDRSASSITINGNVDFTVNGTSTNCQGRLGLDGDVTVGGNVTFTKNTNATTSDVYIAQNTNSAVSISGNLTYSQTGSGTNTRGYIGNNGDLTVGGICTLTNNSSGTNSQIYVANGSTSNSSFSGNIVLESTNASADGIFFGNNGGASTLAAARTITIGGGGFSAGNLLLRNFTQIGATPQSLTITSTGYIYLYDSQWGDATTFTASRILSRGSTFDGNCTLTKNGDVEDRSYGGNVFNGNIVMNNSGVDQFYMSYNLPDSVNGNLTINNSGTRRSFFAHRATGNYVSGNVVLNNTGTGTSQTTISIAQDSASTIAIGGNVMVSNSGTSSDCRAYIGNSGDVTITGNLTATHSATGANGYLYIGNGEYSEIIIGGNTTVTNNSTGTSTHRVYLGENGDLTFSGTLTMTNSSTATNNQIFLNNSVNSSNTYNQNIIINSTGNSDGVYFGNSGGSSTLSATRTISVGGSGFSAGDLRMRNFTQVGGTAQSFTNSGTGYIYLRDCNWGGNVTFSGGRMRTEGTTYQGIANLTKTGASDDRSQGGNTFTGDAILTNSGSAYFGMGYLASDTFSANLTLNNTGTNRMYLAQSSAGNSITGNLTVTNSATGASTYTYISNNSNSTLSIGGNATITNSGSSSDCRTYFGVNGDITLTGNLFLTNSASGSTGVAYVAHGANSNVIVGGSSTVINSGSGTTKRTYLGDDGDVTFSGLLSISNSATANNSQVYCNDGSSSVNSYNGNIVVESTDASCDGIRFGNGQGSGTLAATRTISVGGGGFIGGDLYFRNFTQIGATAQNLSNTGTGYLYNYDCNWGGNVTFSGGRHYTRGTTYQGNATLSKTGTSDDASAGGNSFVGDVILNNSGSGYFGMGNGTSDSFGGDLTINNSSSRHVYIGQNSAGNTIAGNLLVNNSGNGSGNNIYLSHNSSSTLTITGTTALNNTSTATSSYIYLGESGDVTLNNNLTATNNGTGTNGYISIANNSASSVTINGNASITNSAASGTTKRIHFGNNGDVDLNGTLGVVNSSNATTADIFIADGSNSTVDIQGAATVSNSGTGTTTRVYVGDDGDITFQNTLALSTSSPSTNSDIRCNDNTNSTGIYQGNITIESTNAASDGVSFGRDGGNGTLSATRTITVGGGGFISGDMYFRNFTQTGATAQSLTIAGGTGYFYNYDSDWGGNVTFSGPRLLTRGTNYQGTSNLTKTGASDDGSAGGNVFTGNCVLNNSGSGYLLMGNGSADTWSGNLTVNNSGSRHLYIAYNSAGNSIAGNLVSNNTGIGTSYVYLLDRSGSTLSIGGNCSITNSGVGSNVRTYLANSGTLTLTGNLNISNTASGTNSYIYVGSGSSSSITINGNTTLMNNGSGTTSRFYFGENGDITCNGSLSITNSSGSANSQFYVNRTGNSSNTFNGDITLEVTNASSDGILFGNGGGNATLSAGNTINIGAGGFIAGDLQLRNFTIAGSTPSTLALAGTARYYPYDATIGPNMTVSAPRYYSRGTVYSRDFSLTYNGSSNSTSRGGNTFNGETTVNLTGSGRLRLANDVINDYNGDVTFIRSAGTLQPAYNENCTFSGNISVDANTEVTLAANAGSVVIDGAGAQSFNDVGTTSDFTFRRLTLNKASGAFTLNEPLRIQTTVTFTAGIINTDATNLLIFEDNATVTGASNASHVDGPVDKIGNGTNPFAFPVGDNGTYRPISMTTPGNSARFRAQYFFSDPSAFYDWQSKEATIDHISTTEYWTLDRVAGSDAEVITIGWDANSGGVDNLTELTVARWDSGSNIWRDEGNGGTTGNTTEGTIQTGGNVSNFSPFTLASTTANNPLPVSLISFNAIVDEEEKFVDLSWSTSSEFNNAYFTVEKTFDLEEYLEVGTINGNGTTNEENTYALVDEKPFTGTSYYRLKQTDYNGSVEFFNLKKVIINKSKIASRVKAIYPNPNNGEVIYLNVPNGSVENILVTITDAIGISFPYYISEVDRNASNILKLEINQKLVPGSYTVTVVINGEIHNHQLIVK